MTRYVVDENGVITCELGEGDRIVRAKSIEQLEDKERTIYKSFCVLNVEEYTLVMRELDKNSKLVLSQLVPYVQYTTCLLAFSNGKPITSGDMTSVTGLSRHTVENALNVLLDKDILYKGRNSREVQWYINPYIVHRGRLTNKVLQTMFRNYKPRS